ncbi:hypothetical protein WA026_020457 [Henosepilachna vigintioctopunctata]|uniref:Elongator complex protein 5 n=1 Tax=Henosepilachna vigintioctopunctata TaxID=420089 RepID=A0AAW1V9T1_9CUCU
MLNTYIEFTPPTKFILIQDCLQEKGQRLVHFINNHHRKLKHDINYFIFEGNFNKIRSKLSSPSETCYNYTKYIGGKESESTELLEKELKSRLKRNSVIILDSLVHMIYLYGFVKTYKLLNSIIKNIQDGQQIIALFHTDLLENSEKLSQLMEHLATLSITLDPEASRVYYTYKKIGGRVFKQIEDYMFDDDKFKTEALKKPDLNKLVQEKINEVLPEHLTTFKIGLTDDEKESRDNLILPYLPQDSPLANLDEGGQIFYKFDEVDDWDEEDPDDDLDI